MSKTREYRCSPIQFVKVNILGKTILLAFPKFIGAVIFITGQKSKFPLFYAYEVFAFSIGFQNNSTYFQLFIIVYLREFSLETNDLFFFNARGWSRMSIPLEVFEDVLNFDVFLEIL